ncbi:hypothetical protein LP420_15735 [Massilia sp. B-10]|nr:hypothetical protein LP420_15735 [Massilia sp. B-10]
MAAAPEPQHYRVSLPPSASLAMDVTRTDAKGVQWSGQSLMEWRHDGAAYRMSVVASVTLLVTINLVELSSEGTLGEAKHRPAQHAGKAPQPGPNGHPLRPAAGPHHVFRVGSQFPDAARGAGQGDLRDAAGFKHRARRS